MRVQYIIGIITLEMLCMTGCDSDNNSEVKILPIAPTNLEATAKSATQIDLRWTDNSTNEDGFVVERKANSQNYSTIGNLDADITTFSDIGLSSKTTYTYRIYAQNSAGKSLTYSNEATASTISLPELSTAPIAIITSHTAKSGGSITNDGGSTITIRGIIWSTFPEPTILLSTKTENGTGSGQFESSLIDLLPETKYYARAYATNVIGTAYGNEVSFTTLASIADLQLEKLAKEWKLVTATLDGVDKTSDFTSFKLSLTGTKGLSVFDYSVSGRPSLSAWPDSGKWNFGSTPETQMIRDKGTADEMAMTYAVTDSSLIILFTFNGSGYSARTSVVKGAWVFTFQL